MEKIDGRWEILDNPRLQLLENPVEQLPENGEQQLLENPAELMILNPAQELFDNPTRRRRRRGRPRRRTRTRTRVRVRIPRRNMVTNPRHRRRGKRRGTRRLIRRHRKPLRRNPAPAARAEKFTFRELARFGLSGSAGAFCGSGGYYLSKMLLPPEYDRSWVGYTAHGGAATGLAIGVGYGAKWIGLKPSFGALIGAALGTVAFRIFLNQWFSKIPRPSAVISPSPAVETAGLAGIEEAIPAGYDVGDMNDENEMLELAHVSRRFIAQLTPAQERMYHEETAGTGQEYEAPQPYDVGQEYEAPQPYDVGQEYEAPQPYDVGQEYQPARSLPAATMPVGQEPTHQEAPELGAYSKKPSTQWTPLWGATG